MINVRLLDFKTSAVLTIALFSTFFVICADSVSAQTTPSVSDDKSAISEQNVVKKFAAPPYKNLRYDEDYDYLRDPAKRVDRLDRLKFIGLNRAKTFYLSLGGEMRLRYETYRNAAFGSGLQDGDGYFLQRYMLHADFHLGDRLRFFGQLKSGIENGRRGGPRPFDEDKLDVNQAFADVTIFRSEKSSLTARAGRQKVEFGSSRLVSAQEGLTVRQSFDGLRVIYQLGKWQFSPQFIKPARNRFGYFDDRTDTGRTFTGGYVVRWAETSHTSVGNFI